MVSLPYTLALAAASAFLANGAVLPREDSFRRSSAPGHRWGQAAVHLPEHKSAVFIGGRSESGNLLHRADVLNISALHEGVPSAQAWSSLPLSKGVPASTFAAAVVLPGHKSSILVIGGTTETCMAAPGYIFTGHAGGRGLDGSWSALESASTVYDRSHIQAVPVHNATSDDHSILVAGKASARAGCDSTDLSFSPATTEKWAVGRQTNGTSMSIDVTPLPRHLRRDVPVRDYAAVPIEGKNGTEKVIYIGGLTSGKSANSLRHLWVLHVSTGEWQRVRTAGPVQGGLYGHTASLMPNGKIVVVGGYLEMGKNRSMSSSTLELDLQQSPPTWSVKADSQPRVFHSTVAVGHKLIVAFGKTEHSSKRASHDELAFLDTRHWTWSNEFHAASEVPSSLPSSAPASSSSSTPSLSPSSASLSPQPSKVSTSASAWPRTSSPPDVASAPRVASTDPAASKSVPHRTESSNSGMNFGSSLASPLGLESTLSSSPTALPTGDSMQHAAPTSGDNHGISGHTLAAILAPTMAVVLALLLWLLFALCVWRYVRRRRAQVTGEKSQHTRVVSSTGRGAIPPGRRPIESSSTLASAAMWKDEMHLTRSWSPIEQPKQALVLTSPEDKYTPIRAHSVRNLQTFRGRASIKRARETARFQAAQAPSETPASVPSVASPPPAAESREAPVMDEATWFAHPPRRQTGMASPSNGSAVSYPYLQGVPRASLSSIPVPEEGLASFAASEVMSAEAPELAEREGEHESHEAAPVLHADQSGWFEELTSEERGHEQSQGTPVLSTIPIAHGDESDVDPFCRVASVFAPQDQQEARSEFVSEPKPEPQLPEWMQSSSPINSPSMQSARSLRGMTPVPASVTPFAPPSAPSEMPTTAALPFASGSKTGPMSGQVQRTPSGRPLPSVPTGRRTPSAYAQLYAGQQPQPNDRTGPNLPAQAREDQVAAVSPTVSERQAATTPSQRHDQPDGNVPAATDNLGEDDAYEACDPPSLGRRDAIPRSLRPSQPNYDRPKTFHESMLRPAAMQVERPGSYHGPARQVSVPLAPTARLMRPAAMTPRVASASQTSLTLPAPPRMSQLYAPSEGSRASSPTPSERMFAPEGANGLPPAFRLSGSPFLPPSSSL